jgi:transcription antitermination factor NusG
MVVLPNEALWYALQTRCLWETRVEKSLGARGYEVFLPRSRIYKPVSRAREKVGLPLFPGYVFFRMNPAATGSIVTTPGIIRIVGQGSRPTPLEDEDIRSIRRIEDANLNRHACEYMPPNSIVEICSGPLTGVRGQLVTSKGKRKVIVSIELLRRSVAAELDESTILTLLTAR